MFSWLKLLSVLVLWSADAFGEVTSSSPESTEVPVIRVTVEEVNFSPLKKTTTDRVQTLRKDRIDTSKATSLNEAVDRMQGVDSQDYCVNCGAKRISINGLRGDHTSVLIDGIPLYSAISSVYGYDTISMQSVEELEVRRGTGSALLNPESIGGSINILTIDPRETKSRASILLGNEGTQTYEVMHNQVLQNYRFSVGAERSRQYHWDVDKNDFAESPFKERTSAFFKQIWTLSEYTQWSSRLSYSEMEIVGGNTFHLKLSSVSPTQATDSDFEGGDVRRRYLGDPRKITEYIQVKKTEATSKLQTYFDEKNSLEWNLAAGLYDQSSIYMHGFDYDTVDTTIYTDARWSYVVSEQELLLLGASYRYEFLRSASEEMYEKDNIVKDNFDYRAYSLFAQYDWYLPSGLDVSTSLRFEKLTNNWSELGDIERDVVSPRVLLKWQQSESLSQQLAYGRGYRMPLTSIESAHGAYDGFVVDIDELEESHSLLYSLSYNTPTYYLTPSLHLTRLENMAYPKAPAVAHSGPLRFVSDKEEHDIFVYDLLMGYKPQPEWLLELGYEAFRYPIAYKMKLPTAAIEERVQVRAEYEGDNYRMILSGAWIGARSLDQYYQYRDHYNVSDGILGVSDQKWQRAPSFWQWDASFSREFKQLEIILGVQNIFDYTQTKAGDSPAMWHSHDGHTHLDNRHVWGPNRGREIYLKMSANF